MSASLAPECNEVKEYVSQYTLDATVSASSGLSNQRIHIGEDERWTFHASRSLVAGQNQANAGLYCRKYDSCFLKWYSESELLTSPMFTTMMSGSYGWPAGARHLG